MDADLSGLMGATIRATVTEGTAFNAHRVAYIGTVIREVRNSSGEVIFVVIRRGPRPSSDRYIGRWAEIEEIVT